MTLLLRSKKKGAEVIFVYWEDVKVGGNREQAEGRWGSRAMEQVGALHSGVDLV